MPTPCAQEITLPLASCCLRAWVCAPASTRSVPHGIGRALRSVRAAMLDGQVTGRDEQMALALAQASGNP